MKKMAEVGKDNIVINVAALRKGLSEKMSGNLSMPKMCSIFRVPTILSRHSPQAYLPNQFSFGPFHHHNQNLKGSEKIKAKYLVDLSSRLENPNLNPNPKDRATIRAELTEAICQIWKEAQDYYAGPLGMDATKFIEVLVLDGCFIVELFRKKAYDNLIEKDDPIFTMSCLHQFLWHDLILLENQIPWVVLEILFDKTMIAPIDKKPLVHLAIDFFANIFSTTEPPVEPLLSNPSENKHILDLLRNSLVLPSYVSKKRSFGWETMRSATTLKESGIKFKMLAKSESILDIKFDKKRGLLEIPPLFIQETTETIFRNLISLEQCCPNYDAIITSYAVLLDNLINTKDDTEILCKSKAIQTWLNIDDATKFINKLYIDTYVKENYYLQLTKDVNEFCKQSWPTYRRVLMHDYFKHPWALISVIAAFIILILTFLQTLFSIQK